MRGTLVTAREQKHPGYFFALKFILRRRQDQTFFNIDKPTISSGSRGFLGILRFDLQKSVLMKPKTSPPKFP